MRGPLIVVTGTGTSIGKTHVASAVLRAAASKRAVFGYKPIESGLEEGGVPDATRLAAASTFHVQQSPGLRLRAPLSPHLAAELEGATLDWAAIRSFVSDTRAAGTAVLLELPGGLFTPLAHGFRNVDALRTLAPTVTLLLASNRLDVLHDVGAALEGAANVGATVDAVGLVASEAVDASTSSNPREVARIVGERWVGEWPRGLDADLAQADATAEVVRRWLG